MSALDLTLLMAAVATALFFPRRAAVAAVLALAVLQIWAETLYWHFAPLYLLLVVIAVWPERRTRGARASRLILSLLAIAPWCAVVPVPILPRPSGSHAVGSRVYRWVDSSRAEAATDAPDDRRNVIVQAWYPAASTAPGDRVPYLDGLGHLPPYVSVMPRAVMQYYGAIDTHARRDAAPATGRWPVIVFSPGYGAARAFYAGLLAELASRGYVVLALDHPYEAALTELANGTLVTPIERFDPNERDRTQYMARQLAVRTADVRFVLDRLRTTADLASHLDTTRVAVIGHSFGGATAAQAAVDDPRVTAAVNIDGTLYGTLPQRTLARPFLLIESDLAHAHGARYLDGNGQLLQHRSAAAYRFELQHANHYTFTDLPSLLAWPARQVLARFLGGTRNAAETQRTVADLISAFLASAAGGADDVERVAHRHPQLRGGKLGDVAAR